MNFQTGRLIRSESIWQFEDGTEQLETFLVLRILEKLDSPPSEVLNIFEKIILP